MIAVQRSYQLSYQASLELLVFVWIKTYSVFPRKTNQNHVHVFFFILRVHVTNIVISILGKKRKSGFSTILVIF